MKEFVAVAARWTGPRRSLLLGRVEDGPLATTPRRRTPARALRGDLLAPALVASGMAVEADLWEVRRRAKTLVRVFEKRFEAMGRRAAV